MIHLNDLKQKYCRNVNNTESTKNKNISLRFIIILSGIVLFFLKCFSKIKVFRNIHVGCKRLGC